MDMPLTIQDNRDKNKGSRITLCNHIFEVHNGKVTYYTPHIAHIFEVHNGKVTYYTQHIAHMKHSQE